MHLTNPTRRTRVLLALALPVAGVLTAVGAGAAGIGEPASPGTDSVRVAPRSSSSPSTTVDGIGSVDISGPCDEAEHANDPRCAGVTPAPAPTSPTGGVDISGPCDEAEHANDPRCAGVTPAPAPTSPTGGVDISGPCDEAEHANDPRCTGAGEVRGSDDDSTHDSGHDGTDDSSHDVGDDHGGDDSDDDSSGHGGDDSDDSEDSDDSDDSDDSSGHGSDD